MRFVAGRGAVAERLARTPWQNCRSAVAKMQMHRRIVAGPPQSTIGKKLPSGAPMPSSTKRHREEAAKQDAAAEHLRTRVLAFAAAALAFAASGSCPIEQPSATTTKFERRNWISPKMVYLCLKLESRKDVQERRHINPFGKR